MSDYPNITRGTRWSDTSAKDWQNVFDDARSIGGIHAGPGLLADKVGDRLSLRVTPELMNLLLRNRPGTTVTQGGTNLAVFQLVNHRYIATLQDD